MQLSVKDIINDLGVSRITVWKWINQGRIKATMKIKKEGWRIEEEDYRAFLDENPKYRMIHDGEVFKRDELAIREDALLRVSAQIAESKAKVQKEGRSDPYMNGYDRAMVDITSAINREMARKMPA